MEDRFVVEGKAKRANAEAPMQRGSSGSPETCAKKGTAEEAKKAGKEIDGVEDPLMNHRAKVLVEAVGLQKVQCSSRGEHCHS